MVKPADLSDSQKWLVLTLLALFAGLIYLLAPVLTPFLVSALLAYLGDPLVDRLERLGAQRSLAVVLVFAVMLVAGIVTVVFLVPVLQRQAVSLLNGIPHFLQWLQDSFAPMLAEVSGIPLLDFDIEAIRKALVEHWQKMGSLAGVLVQQIGRSGQVILGWVTYLLLIPVVTFYLLRDWDLLVSAVHELLPKRIEATVSKLAREIDAVLAEFLRGQVTVMLALAVIYTVGLWLVGLELALVIGLTAGVVSFVPYLGVIVGVIVAGLAAFVQFHDAPHLLGVAAVFGVGQLLEGMVLSPLLVGDRIGLHPVAVIFAVMAGGQLFGFFGVLLALPVAAVIVVLLRYFRDEYFQSALYDSPQ